MSHTFRRFTALAGSTLMLTAGLIGISSGEANAIARINYCGSNYSFLKSWPIYDVTSDHSTVGYIDVYYSSSSGNNCAISRANDSVTSGADHITVGIKRSDSTTWHWDPTALNANYTQYAGPVYVPAAGTCIDIDGSLQGNFYGVADAHYTGVHCG